MKAEIMKRLFKAIFSEDMVSLKKIAQTTFMKHYNKSIEEFREIFGKNYIK